MFSQYFGSLPPFFDAKNGDTLAPYNLYRFRSGIDVFLPKVAVSQGEWVLLINTDIAGISKLDSNDIIRPVVKVQTGDVKIKRSSEDKESFSEMQTRPGSASIYVRVADAWFLSQFDLSTLSDARIAELRSQVSGALIKVASVNLLTSTLRKETDAINEIVLIPAFRWLGVNNLSPGNIIRAPSNYPNGSTVSYWSFDLTDAIAFPLIYYDTPGSDYKIIRITDRTISSDEFKITKPNGNFTLSGGTIENNQHVFGASGLYKLRYSSLVRRYVLETFKEENLPPPISIYDIVERIAEQVRTLNDGYPELPSGEEFPENPLKNVFRIDGGDKYPKGIYIFDGINWIAQF